MNRKQALSYGAITLDLLYKMKIKITPKIFAEEMNIVFDLYDEDKVEDEYNNMLNNNKILNKNISGRANCYIINTFDSANEQRKMIEAFCNKKIELGRIYITPPGQNSELYYELIRDIRNKNMDILFITIFTILGMNEDERAMIVKLCRKNNITIVEV